MKSINFKGIVRCTSPQNNADGNCDEIVNMRVDAGIWRVVGKKNTIIENVNYERVYVHKYGAFENFIGVKSGKCFWFASRKDEDIEEKNQKICDVSGKVSFNQLNNILLVKDDTGIAKAIFRENKYSVSSVKLPDAPVLDVKVKMDEKKSNNKVKLSYTVSSEFETKSFEEAVRNLINQSEDNGFYEGSVFVTATYELFDGSETKPTPPMLVELGKYCKDAIWRENVKWSIDEHSLSVHSGTFWASSILGELNVKVSNTLGEEFKNTITKINVYVTPAYSFYADKVEANAAPVMDTDGSQSSMIAERKLTPEEISQSLFYKALSVGINDATHDYTAIDFDAITTNKTMRVDASGWQDTTGNMFTYNNRLHLFNVRQKFVEDANLSICLEGRYQIAEVGGHGEEPPVYNYDFTKTRTLKAVFHLKMEQADARVTVDDFRVELQSEVINPATGRGQFKVRLPRFMAFPDSRAYKVDLYDGNSFVKSFDLEASAAYNYSFLLFKVTTSGLTNRPTVKDESIIEYSNAVDVPNPDFEPTKAFDDNMNLIVSEAMNPYYFPPEHSYLMPGEIINLAVNTEQISTSQVGQFPLYVFTTEGIYALQVGDGKVLYSHVIPVSAEVAVKGSDVLQTKYGVVFATEKGLKVISGNEVVDFSAPVNGPLDGNIREAETYAGATDNPGMGVEAAKYLSRAPFREYVREAVMGYDISEDEVIVSNPEYDYSYVFSLKTKTWHKISEVFSDLNRHVGLKEYMAGAVAAQAVLRVECTVRPGRVVTFRKSATLRDRVFSMGYVSITLEMQGVDLPPFTCPTHTPVSLYDVIRAMNVPEEFLKVLEDEGKVFSNIYTGLRVANETVEIGEHFAFVPDVREIPVDGVGEGEEFSVMLGSRKLTHTTVGTDTTRSIANRIAAWAVEGGFTARAHSQGVDIGAKPGAEGNRTLFSFVSSEHVELSSEGFSGGADTHRSRKVCDIRQEEECIQPVYLQTRPLSLDFYGFKKVSHCVLRGELKPAADKGVYGVFVFASNDLMHWECVADGGIRTDVPHVLLPRLFHSFRYFVVMTGGYVRPGHVVTHAELDGEAKYDNRLR